MMTHNMAGAEGREGKEKQRNLQKTHQGQIQKSVGCLLMHVGRKEEETLGLDMIRAMPLAPLRAETLKLSAALQLHKPDPVPHELQGPIAASGETAGHLDRTSRVLRLFGYHILKVLHDGNSTLWRRQP